jgi:hypothetical protein
MYLFSSSLHIPDDSSWKESRGYSSDIAGVLITAYSAVVGGKGAVRGYTKALAVAMPSVKARMSRRQRLHLYFILATSAAAGKWYDEALYWVDRAIPLALQLEDVAAQLELLALRTSLNRAILKLLDAIEDCQMTLERLDAQYGMLGIDDPAARLQTHGQMAMFAYFIGQRFTAEHHLATARSLAPLVHEPQFDSAAAEWVQAHLYRTYGEPERALRHTLGFYDMYIREAGAVSQDRLEFFIAEVAMDWAEKLPPGTDRDAFLALSFPHLSRAEQLATASHDMPGMGLALLARTHYSRLSGANVERTHSLEAVIHLGYMLDDVAIKAQAYTALGDEFAGRGEKESARNCYRRTLDVLAYSQVGALGIPARRAISHT